MTKAEFIKTLFPIIKKVGTAENVSDFIMLACLSQAALETGFGSSTMMIKANAVFGIKAPKSWRGKVYSSKTKEVYSGITQTISAVFKAYDTLEDSIKDYFKLLKTKRYSKCLFETSVPDALHAIATCGYATDPDYARKCISIYQNYIKGNIDIITADTSIDTFNVSPADADIDKLARDVLKGKYGNGEQRKRLLGTNYAAVQHRVNILLRGGE